MNQQEQPAEVQEKVGIEEFEQAARTAAKFINPVLDGFQFMNDVGPLTSALVSLPEAVEGAEKIPLELADLDEVEIAVINKVTDEELTNLPKLGEKAVRIKQVIQNAILANIALFLVLRS